MFVLLSDVNACLLYFLPYICRFLPYFHPLGSQLTTLGNCETFNDLLYQDCAIEMLIKSVTQILGMAISRHAVSATYCHVWDGTRDDNDGS
jgi:hypothetical protein